MSGSLILVDDKDNLLGYASRYECHRGRGRRHRAFVTVLFDEDNRVLLHRRRHALFDGLWDLTAISHPLRINGRNETYQEASDRALSKEMGIAHVPSEKIGAFNYIAFDGANCENEHCVILIGNYNGEFKANNNEVYEAKKVSFGKFIGDCKKNPQKYTPWAKLAAKRLTKSKVKVKSQSLLKEELKQFLKVFESYSQQYFLQKIKDSAKYPPLIRQFYKDLFDFSLGGKRLRAFLVWLGYQAASGPAARHPRPTSSLQSNLEIEMNKSSDAVGARRGSPTRVTQSALPDTSDMFGILSTTATRSGKLAGGLKKILPIALAVEIIHDFLLIHDDIIDQSDRRRGKSTIHKRYGKLFGSHYGISQAIILGDIACFEAFKLIDMADFEDDLKIAAQKRLLVTLIETGYGEALDVEYVYKKPTFSAIWQMTQAKTATYSFVGPLTCGAILGKVKKAQLESLVTLGLAAGTAFQLHDDILGLFGDEEVIGKSVLSDLREGKNTLLIYKAKELAKADARRVLDRLWGKRDANFDELQKVKKIITDSGALAWCESEQERLIRSAKGYVGKITCDEKLQRVFFELGDFVIKREK